MTVRKGLFLVFTERALSTGATFVAFMILARLLTPEEIGIYSVGAALIVVAHALRDFGQANYILQEKDLTRSKLAAVQTVAFVTGWTATLLILLVAGPAAEFYDEPRLRAVIQLLAINFFILPFGSPALGMLRREMAFATLFRINIFSIVSQSIVSVSLAFLDFSYMSLVLGSIVGTLVNALAAMLYRPGIALIKPTFAGLKPVLQFGLFASGTGIIGKLALSANDMVIGKVIGFAPTAFYSRGQSLALLVHEQLVNAALKVLVTAFAKEHREKTPLASTYLRTICLLTVIAWPVYAFIGINSHEMLLLLFGDQWTPSAKLATILTVAFAVATVVRPGPQILIATGNVKRLFRLETTQQSVRLAVVLIAVHHGLETLAYAMIGFYFFALFLYHFAAIHQAVSVSLSSVVQSCSKSAAVTAVYFLAVSVSSYHLRNLELPIIIKLAASFFAGAMTWFATVFVFRHPIRHEVILASRYLMTSVLSSAAAKKRQN